ncbi:MAG: anaerobic ribonucleoside-triphosphate reductase activating protein [Bacteroidia bacterium]
MIKPIYSISPFTLLDYPDKTACILWFAGCNMRCVYCYNPDIVLGKGKLTFNDALKFINSRQNLLDGVVLSGGECTSHKSIAPFLKELKAKNLLVKVDTNGSNPDVLKKWIDEELINYVALDFKAPPYKFCEITKSELYANFNESLQFLIENNFPFEVRTTIHSDLLNQSDIQQMIMHLQDNNYKGVYYLQNFRNDTETLGKVSSSNRRFIDVAKLNTNIQISIRN